MNDLNRARLRAIVPAAGKGTRLNLRDADMPKAMLELNGRPMLEIVLENLGFISDRDITVVVGYGKDRITEYFGAKYNYVEQKEQLGTGHAVLVCADSFADFDGDVLVTFGDMPLFRRDEMAKMCRFHDETGAACTMMTAENPNLKLWARIVRDGDGRFQAIVEGKDCTPEQAQIRELFSGVLVFDSRALFETLPLVGRGNVQGEYYLTEVPELMAKRGLRVETFLTADGDDLRGVNTPEDVRICEEILKARI